MQPINFATKTPARPKFDVGSVLEGKDMIYGPTKKEVEEALKKPNSANLGGRYVLSVDS